MGDEYQQDPRESGQPTQGDLDKRIEDIRRIVVQGANEAQQRIKQVVDKASTYLQQNQAQPPQAPHQPSSVEEQHIRQLVNIWSDQNWRVARELGSYMEIVSWSSDEVWEITLQTRWESRSMDLTSEPYTGKSTKRPQPLLPIWDYELPPVTGLKAPPTQTPLEGLDEVVACTACNSTGHVMCNQCSGRGWIVCPDCKGRTKKRCNTCRGRGYVSDWAKAQKKPFFKRQAENVANSVGGKVSDVFDNIRQSGVPIPNPLDNDPAGKGPTVPCPDCINGEVDCTCGNGKRVCANCEGAKMSLCSTCNGTGKLVRHRGIARRFDLSTQARVVGEVAIPESQLSKASGDVAFTSELTEPIYADAPPESVPVDVWNTAVEMVNAENKSHEKPGADIQATPRATLQVLELVHIPYSKVQYRYSNQDYDLFIYDGEGKEKFYANSFPARWDNIGRLFKAITADLTAPLQRELAPMSSGAYRVPIELPSYNIAEEDEDSEKSGKPNKETPPDTNR